MLLFFEVIEAGRMILVLHNQRDMLEILLNLCSTTEKTICNLFRGKIVILQYFSENRVI